MIQLEPFTDFCVDKPWIIEAFYLASKQDEYVADDIIAGYTGLFPCNWGTPDASHEERGYFINGKLWFFSSTARAELGAVGGTKKDGTRYITADQMLRHPERWLLMRKRAYSIQIWTEIKRANSLLGMGYDHVGVVLDYVRPAILFNEREVIYCSKSCHFVEFGVHRRISPRRRFAILDAMYQPITVEEVMKL